MLKLTTTRGMVGLLGILAAGLLTVTAATPPDTFGGNVVLGRPTNRAVTASVLAEKPLEAYVE